jgi:putative oxidoreductase
LRVAAAIPAIQHGIAALLTTPVLAHALPLLLAAGASALLLAGLWTPITGVLLALTEMFLAFSHSQDPGVHVLLGTLGAALAMLGPGAWSVDARLFGRKRIRIPQR